MSFYYFWWPFLLGVPFLLPEIVAATDKKPGNTFSEWIWKIYALVKSRAQRYGHLRRATFGAFWSALSGHFFLQTSAWWIILAAVVCIWPAVYHYRHEKALHGRGA